MSGLTRVENIGEKGGLPILAFPSREAWAAWLDEHHTDSAGVWLTLRKKDAGEVGVSYGDAVEVSRGVEQKLRLSRLVDSSTARRVDQSYVATVRDWPLRSA